MTYYILYILVAGKNSKKMDFFYFSRGILA